MIAIDAQRALRELAAAEMDEFWREHDLEPGDRAEAIECYARQLAASGGVPDEILQAMPEISRHDSPQCGPQEYECGCVAVVRVTDRDVWHGEKPFELRLAFPCDGTKCSRREVLMCADGGSSKIKACVKCDGPITTPLLGKDDERCVHCADFDPDDPDSAERDARDADDLERDIDDHDRCVDQAVARGLITNSFRDSAADRRALDAREQRAKVTR